MKNLLKNVFCLLQIKNELIVKVLKKNQKNTFFCYFYRKNVIIMKFLIKIILLAFIINSTSRIIGVPDKVEQKKKEVKSIKKKKKKRGKAFFFAVYCIACYAISPFVFDYIFKLPYSDEEKQRYVKREIEEFEKRFDKVNNAEINRQKQSSYISWGLHVLLEDQVKKELAREKEEKTAEYKKYIISEWEEMREKYYSTPFFQRKFMADFFSISPFSLPIFSFFYLFIHFM